MTKKVASIIVIIIIIMTIATTITYMIAWQYLICTDPYKYWVKGFGDHCLV